jgi:hypothetical protein
MEVRRVVVVSFLMARFVSWTVNASKSPRLNNQLLHVPKVYTLSGKGTLKWKAEMAILLPYLNSFSRRPKKGCNGKFRRVLRLRRLVEVIFPLTHIYP